MIRKMLIQSSISVLLGLSATSQASADEAQMREDYQKLKHSSSNYQPFGTVCEEVAKLRLQERYSNEDYEVLSGIGYFHRSGRQIGELDVVVIRKSDNEAIVIAEVKCWNNLSSARKKAMNQLNRFKNTIDRNTPIKMHLMDNESTLFSSDQFDEQPEFITVSQNGGLSRGFDMVLGIELSEAATLRDAIMRCQKTGRCKLSQ